MSSSSSPALFDILIVGGGPAGLAAAIACHKRGLRYEVIEKGVLVNSIYRFPVNMVFFTTPELLEIGDLPLVSPFEKPTRLEALRYYRRVVDRYHLNLSTEEKVLQVSPVAGDEEAELEVRSQTAAGEERVRRSKAVVLATGYFEYPNRLDIPGEDLPHVSHYYDQSHPFYRKRVVVVGGGNSAAEAALELYRAGAHVTLVHRGETLSSSVKYWVSPDVMNRIKEGSIVGRFGASVTEVTPKVVRIERGGEREEIPADAVFLLTGYHSDREFLRRCGVQLDPLTCTPCHDPETLETNVRNVFLAGGVIAGINTTSIFIENGRFHGEKVVGEIAARLGSGGEMKNDE